MKKLLLLCCVIGLAGCSATRVSRYDEFEKMRVDKMVGNEVKLHVLTRTVVCLNAMREAKWSEPLTNQVVNLTTNYVVTSLTNLTVTSSSNEQLSSNTNAAAVAVAQKSDTPAEAGETNVVVISTAAISDSASGGVTLSSSRNESTSTGPNQSVFSQTLQRTTLLSNQGTVNTNQQAVTTGTNQMVTVETNIVVTSITNQVITPVTNVTVISPDQPVFDYYLYTELAPPDFLLQPGESLVVLVDGARYSFSPAQPQSGWTTRRGYLTTFYKVPAEVVVAIANAQEVKLRIKGSSGTLERELSAASRQNFREFFSRNFHNPFNEALVRKPT